MNKETVDFVVAKSHELMEAFSCSKEAREAALSWIKSVGTESEKEETKRYLAELEADIMPIDTLIAFASSEGGAAVFGPEKTKEVAEHAKEIKASGAKYCDCPACTAAYDILSKKDEILQ